MPPKFKSSVVLIIKYSSEKRIENEYINTSIKDIYQKYTKHFQDLVGVRISNKSPINCIMKCKSVTNKTASLEF